jgi:hypothetical protein
MKKKIQHPTEDLSQTDERPSSEGHLLTVMAIQEILGLFRPKSVIEEKQDRHEYLKKKPLGLI